LPSHPLSTALARQIVKTVEAEAAWHRLMPCQSQSATSACSPFTNNPNGAAESRKGGASKPVYLKVGIGHLVKRLDRSWGLPTLAWGLLTKRAKKASRPVGFTDTELLIRIN
jgi:hypothetical protein